MHDLTFPILDSPAACAALWPRYPQKVVGMWATGMPRQNVDVLWRLREELLKLGVPVIFFFNWNAKPMLRTVLAADASLSAEGIYQLDDAKFFRLLNFVEVLVTNDYQVYYQHARHIGAKLVGLPHHAGVMNPKGWNYFYDYFVSDKNQLSKFDYSCLPDSCKLHRNSHFTQLVAGHPKIDLILEERQKNIAGITTPVLLCYPAYAEYAIHEQNINPEKYLEIWSDTISAFLSWCPKGVVVFRPPASDRNHPLMEQLRSMFAEDGRFFLDEDDDNKFWLARARYFVTDYSEGFINFALTSLRPTVRMVYSWEEREPVRDEWGWVVSQPRQIVPLLETMDRDEKAWRVSLRAVQEREMPTLGRNFALLAGMIQRIFNNDDDPAWLTLEKGRNPCRTSGEMLKLAAHSLRTFRRLVYLTIWLDDVGRAGCMENPRMWLLFLKRALLPLPARDSPEEIARYVDMGLSHTLNELPPVQSVGLLRHCLRKDPQLAASALLMAVTSVHVSGYHKKRALFFLLMESRECLGALKRVNELAQKMPQHFSRPVLDRLNRYLPLAMKIPLTARRVAARVMGLKKPLAKKYWGAHQALADNRAERPA